MRVSNNVAATAVASREWTYTSKSKYKRVSRNKKQKYPAGMLNSKMHMPTKIHSSKISKHTESFKKATGGKNFRKGRFEIPEPSALQLLNMTSFERLNYLSSPAYDRHQQAKKDQAEITERNIAIGKENVKRTMNEQAKKRKAKLEYEKQRKTKQNAE